MALSFQKVLSLREWRLRLAERHAEAGRSGAAEGTFHKILAREPKQSSALTGLGRLLLRNRRFEEAVEIWQRAVEIRPRSTDPAFQLARALHRSGRLEAAAAQYLRVLELDPLHEKAFIAIEQLSSRLSRSSGTGTAAIEAATALARQLVEQAGSERTQNSALSLLASLQAHTDPDAAARYWEQLAVQNPRSVQPVLAVARIRKRQHNSGEAQRFFRAVLDNEPDHPEALAGLGQCLADLDHAAAVDHFVSWSKRRPQEVAPLLELARLHQKAQEWDRAERIYRQILAMIPDDRSSLLRLAQILSRDPSRLELALDLWQRVSERDPAAPLALVQRAYLLERARRPIEAEVEYRAALRRAPKDAMALIGLARLLAKQERWHEASTFFEASHRVSPGRTDVLLGLGRCLERLDQGNEALIAYQKVLALDPANGNAQLYRGRLLRQLGRSDEAIEAWRDVCTRTPQNADEWYELVFMLGSAERDAEALIALEAGEAALPASPASWVRLGMAAQAGQFHERAVDYFQRAVTAEPQEPGHHARLGDHFFRQGIIDGAFHHLLASRELKPDDIKVARQLVDTVQTLDILGIDPIVLSKAPPKIGEVLAPECLFRLVRHIADTEVVRYEPMPRTIVAISASLAGGGAERQLVNLLRGLSHPALDLDLTLFCISLARRTRRDFFLPLLKEAPVEVVTVEDKPVEDWLAQPEVAPYLRLIRSFPADMVGPIAFWLTEFRRRRPEVVHAWQDGTSLTAAVAALLAGVPRIILAARSVRPDNPRRRLKRFMREGYQAVLGHPSVALSNNSRAGANDYAQWLDVEPATIEVIHNGIDCDQLVRTVDLARADELRLQLGVPRDAPIIGSAFRMSEEKRPLLWVEVAAQVAHSLPQAHFVVYGDGPMRPDMLALAARLGIADRFHLPGPEDDIASCYKAMEVVLLTSRHEGLPNVLLEAQLVGVPVVAPDVGGIGEAVLPGVTGWIVSQADARILAERVVACVLDKEWADTARIEGPRFIRQRFDIARMVQRTLEVYGLEGVPARVSIPLAKSGDLALLDKHLFRIMTGMLRSDGPEASGLYAYYEARIEQRRGALSDYDHMLFDYVSTHFDRESRQIVHAGIGLGTLACALSAAGYRVSGIESDAPRFRAANRLRNALSAGWPAATERYDLVEGLFPGVVEGTHLASPKSVLIFTNFVTTWPEGFHETAIASLQAFGDVILDARLFGSIRDTPEERQALIDHIEAQGLVATPINESPPMAFYYHLRPRRPAR